MISFVKKFIKLVSKTLSKTIHQSYFVILFCLGIIIGTIVSLVFRINFFVSFLWPCFVISLLIIIYLRPKILFCAIALFAGIVLAFFRSASELISENYIHQFYDQTITVTGVVANDPVTDTKGTKCKITSLQLHFSEEQNPEQSAVQTQTQTPPLAGSFYLLLKTHSQIQRSDHLTLSGKLSKGFGTYSGFLYHPIISAIERPSPGDPVLNLRQWFSARISGLLPETESSLGLSYLLGMKTNLPDTLSANLRTVGLVHIVVASGAHLSILVEIARRLFGKLSRFSGLLFSILFILFFMAVVGFTPSIMRAGLMSIFSLVAWYFGRKIAPLRLILIVAAITLMINPMFLIDLGWLLSFASFAGIMLLSPKLIHFFYGTKPPGFIASTIFTTISATLMTLPIILYYYGMVSLISLLANLLILPTLPYAMGGTFLVGLFADLPTINHCLAMLTTNLLNFHITIVNFLAQARSFIISVEPYHPEYFLIYLFIFLPLIKPFITKNSLLMITKLKRTFS